MLRLQGFLSLNWSAKAQSQRRLTKGLIGESCTRPSPPRRIHLAQPRRRRDHPFGRQIAGCRGAFRPPGKAKLCAPAAPCPPSGKDKSQACTAPCPPLGKTNRTHLRRRARPWPGANCTLTQPHRLPTNSVFCTLAGAMLDGHDRSTAKGVWGCVGGRIGGLGGAVVTALAGQGAG